MARLSSLNTDEIVIRMLTPATKMAIAKQLIEVINWAYRGKPGEAGWTGSWVSKLMPNPSDSIIFVIRRSRHYGGPEDFT